MVLSSQKEMIKMTKRLKKSKSCITKNQDARKCTKKNTESQLKIADLVNSINDSIIPKNFFFRIMSNTCGLFGENKFLHCRGYVWYVVLRFIYVEDWARSINHLPTTGVDPSIFNECLYIRKRSSRLLSCWIIVFNSF
jgi:hypothetical protein